MKRTPMFQPLLQMVLISWFISAQVTFTNPAFAISLLRTIGLTMDGSRSAFAMDLQSLQHHLPTLIVSLRLKVVVLSNSALLLCTKQVTKFLYFLTQALIRPWSTDAKNIHILPSAVLVLRYLLLTLKMVISGGNSWDIALVLLRPPCLLCPTLMPNAVTTLARLPSLSRSGLLKIFLHTRGVLKYESMKPFL